MNRSAYGLDSPHVTDWRELARCRDLQDPDQMYPIPINTSGVAAAKRICAACPVTAQCLAEAEALGDYEGVRGGLTGEERKKAARPQPIACRDCDRQFVPGRVDVVRCPWCRAARPRERKQTCPDCRRPDVRVRVDGSLARHRARGTTVARWCEQSTTTTTPIGAPS